MEAEAIAHDIEGVGRVRIVPGIVDEHGFNYATLYSEDGAEPVSLAIYNESLVPAGLGPLDMARHFSLAALVREVLQLAELQWKELEAQEWDFGQAR